MVAFSLGCKRPAPFHAPTREAGKQARQAPCLLGLFLSPSPLHHKRPIRSPAAPLFICHLEHHPKKQKKPTVGLWSMCALNVGVFSPWVRPPYIKRSLPTTERGGLLAHTEHAFFSFFFFSILMRNRRKREGERMFGRKKRWMDFSKTATEDLFDRGRKERGGESRDILDVETNMCTWNRITPMLLLITSR